MKRKWNIRVEDPNGPGHYDTVTDGIKCDVDDHPLYSSIKEATFRISDFDSSLILVNPDSLKDARSKRRLRRNLHRAGIWGAKF